MLVDKIGLMNLSRRLVPDTSASLQWSWFLVDLAASPHFRPVRRTADPPRFPRLEAALRRAREETSFAYQFVPSSYTNGALEAVVAAQIALEVLGEEISAEAD